jgi:imidazoleglycerol phosphate dehydratase HisB
MRKTIVKRKTTETEIELEIGLDGVGKYEVECKENFFKHMLELFAKNALLDLKLKASGDLEHHIIEDIGICLGQALKEALGEKKGINRYGFFVLPMDESTALVAIDLSGRSNLEFQASFNCSSVEGFSTELMKEFFLAFCREAKCNVFIQLLSGSNEHHKIEAIFKCFGRALRKAIEFDERIGNSIPSTKGSI